MPVKFPRKALPVLLLAVAVFTLHNRTVAQSNDADAAHAPDPDPGTVGYSQGLFVPMVAGQPFRAKIEGRISRRLPDGNSVEEKYYDQEARDSAGRIYREVRDTVAANSDEEPTLLRSTIYDPTTLLITFCLPERRTCRQTAMAPSPANDPLGASSDGRFVLTQESLGTKTMDGLKVVGTRETRTYAAGAFGNDKPLVTTKEFWYAPQLHFNLSVTRSDPRYGTQKLEVTELKLGDPGPEWFSIPDGYRMVSEQTFATRAFPPDLEPLIEKQVPSMTPDQLRAALEPVEKAITAYAEAHADATRDNRIDVYEGQLRTQLSSNLRLLQQSTFPDRVQNAETADKRLNEDYQEVLTSPCLNRPAPGDPAFMPKDDSALRKEERAWMAYRDAWTDFLEKLYPNNRDPRNWAWLLTNERDLDLRRMQTVERNRGCLPEESLAPVIANFVPAMPAAELAATLVPVDAALTAYIQAHAESTPQEVNQFFGGMTRQSLVADLRMQQQGEMPTKDQFEDADLRLNQVYREVIASPCLAKTAPGDPPGAPVSEEKLRAEERAWVALRDAWTKFMTGLYPNAAHAGFGTALTEERANELQQIRVIERNRGCPSADAAE